MNLKRTNSKNIISLTNLWNTVHLDLPLLPKSCQKQFKLARLLAVEKGKAGGKLGLSPGGNDVSTRSEVQPEGDSEAVRAERRITDTVICMENT